MDFNGKNGKVCQSCMYFKQIKTFSLSISSDSLCVEKGCEKHPKHLNL